MSTIKKILLTVLIPCFAFVMSHADVSQNNETLYQYSTIQALQTGIYDGEITVGDLNSKGDFGIGTFNGLDGEMVILNGVCYQIKNDGFVYPCQITKYVPFAMITGFNVDKSLVLKKEQNKKQVENLIDNKITSKNIICAIKVHGLFKTIRTRSEPKQNKPYKGLDEVLKTQSEFEYSNELGTMVGFRMPSAFDGVNKVGYHFHYISDSKKTGGHVLDFVVKSADIEIDETPNYFLELPQSNDFLKAHLSTPVNTEPAAMQKTQP